MTDIRQAFEAEIPCLQRYALRLARDAAVAEDLVQESLMRALDKQHLWQEGTNLRAWLCTILHNQYVNQVRRSVRERGIAEISKVSTSLAQPPSQDKRLELRDLDRALKNLPATQRAAVLLIGLEGLRYDRAAEIVGVRVGTVRSRLSRGREKLRMAA
jgi:RNA polymerase sigma-70 factor, ECF subfamily